MATECFQKTWRCTKSRQVNTFTYQHYDGSFRIKVSKCAPPRGKHPWASKGSLGPFTLISKVRDWGENIHFAEM